MEKINLSIKNIAIAKIGLMLNIIHKIKKNSSFSNKKKINIKIFKNNKCKYDN